jgi:2-aminoadipate transaminase
MKVDPGRWSGLFAKRTRADVGEGIAAILALANADDVISFAGGFPDPATFPGSVLGDLFEGLLGDSTAFQYGPTAGLPGLRERLALRLERLQGVRPGADELVVTSGSIEALELVGKAFLDPGDQVVVEAPTYLGAIMAFRSFEARVAAVPMDAGGLMVDRLDGERPKLLYTIPDHHNPAGLSLALDRRRALVALARRHGFVIIEDVAYRELGFDGEALPSLWSLAPDVVVQLGTFSKVFFPGVRLGWAVGPAEIISRLVAAKQNTDQCAGTLGQRLLEEYERRGHLDAQIARARALYARRCQLMLDALARHLGDRAAWTRPRGGFFTWVSFAPDSKGTVDAVAVAVDTVDLGRRAGLAKVAFAPGTLFYPDGRGAAEARLSYSKVRDEDIDRGIERLAALL